MKKYDVVGYMIPLEDGLTKEQIIKLADYMDMNEEYIPFEVSQNNTSIIAFIDVEKYDSEEYSFVTQKLNDFCEDWNELDNDGEYVIIEGLTIKILCDYETVK